MAVAAKWNLSFAYNKCIETTEEYQKTGISKTVDEDDDDALAVENDSHVLSHDAKYGQKN